MAGFRKAEPKQAAIKMSIYGPPGSGKTFSTLLCAEGLARHSKKRIAYVDTERGTDFYAMPVAERQPHPEPFDFDALYTRSLTETLEACHRLDAKTHGVLVIDSISHLWDTAIASYRGPKTPKGGIPMHAWGHIKAPYKALMKFLIDSPYHVFILGRQANVFEDDGGDVRAAGVKMRAEGETAYEPHICLRMEPRRAEKEGRKTVVHKQAIISAFAEKDRSGILSGKTIDWPCFENLIAPVLGILTGEQGATPSDDDAASQDAEALAQAEREKARHSHDLAQKFTARFQLAETRKELEAVANELTPAMKKQLTAVDLTAVRTAYLTRCNQMEGRPAERPAEEEEAA